MHWTLKIPWLVMYTSTTRTVLGEFSELQYSLSPSYQAARLLVSLKLITSFLKTRTMWLGIHSWIQFKRKDVFFCFIRRHYFEVAQKSMWSQIYSDYGDDKYQAPLDIHRFAHLLDFMAKNFKRNRNGIPTWRKNLIAMAIKDHRHVIVLVGTKL